MIMADAGRFTRGRRAHVHDLATRVASVAVAVAALVHLALGALDPPASHDLAADVFPLATSAMWIVRIVVALGAGLCFLLGPGVVLRRLRPRGLITNTAFVWIPGAMYLLAVGTIAWGLEKWIDPTVVCIVLLLPVPAAVLWCASRWTTDLVPVGERSALLLFLLVVLVGIGVSTYSRGPEGELYGGTISRTLEAGPRSDSRISYNVIALLAHGDSPYDAYGTMYYAPYTFYDRGPIAGLGSGAVVMAGGASPLRAQPDAPWEPFDAQGFETYRIMMMLFNATAVLAAYGLVRSFLRSRLAVAAAALVALSPFVVYQTYFTWPKLLAASYVLAAAVALLHRRSLLAGALLGLGYLAHPSALFAVPAVLLAWLVLRERGPGAVPIDPEAGLSCGPKGFWRWCLDAVVVGIGLGVVYFGWRVLNAGHITNNFNQYLTQAYGLPHRPFGEWLSSRGHLVANTFVPFRQAFTDAHDSYTNAPGLATPFIVRLNQQWRGTITVAAGLVYVPMFAYGFARFTRRALLLATTLVFLPLAAFFVFWGANTTGALQEGLHAIFLFALLTSFIGHTVFPHSRSIARWVQVTATARVVEVLFMVLVPTLATTSALSTAPFRATDCFAFLVLGVGLGGLAHVSWTAFAPDRITAPAPIEAMT
jgi:hypothetical protein